MPFAVGGQTAIVAGIRAGLLVRTPTKSSYAQSPILAPMARVATSTPGDTDTTALPAELAAARAEILRAQERIAGLAVLVKDHQARRSGRLEGQIGTATVIKDVGEPNLLRSQQPIRVADRFARSLRGNRRGGHLHPIRAQSRYPAAGQCNNHSHRHRASFHGYS